MQTTYDGLALEELAREKFGLVVDIKQVLVANAPVSHTSTASVFMTKNKQVYVYITGQARLNVGDIRKIVTRMGLKPELFLPPRGEIDYFNEFAREKFKEIYPGRSNVNDADLAYYKTLAPYRPALIQIAEVKDGHIYQFDTDSHAGWRVARAFSYRRIKTS
jgi:hypothetical protein